GLAAQTQQTLPQAQLEVVEGGAGLGGSGDEGAEVIEGVVQRRGLVGGGRGSDHEQGPPGRSGWVAPAVLPPQAPFVYRQAASSAAPCHSCSLTALGRLRPFLPGRRCPDVAERAAVLAPPCRPEAVVVEDAADPALAERVARALGATGYLPLRAVEVSVHGRVTLLQGRVPSYYLKQVAQVSALAVPE